MCLKNFDDLRDMELEYENIHSHSYYSNIMTHDSVISRTDIAKRAKELGHQTLSCLEHGYCGNLYEAYNIAKEHDLNLIFGTEFYYVKDRFEKDRTNSHVLVVAKTEVGREAITGLISEANTTGFYGRPRIDESLLFSLPPNDVIVTTACIASPVNLYDDEYAHYFVKRGKEYFGDNFFLEIQPHTNKKQQDFHEKLLVLQKEYDVEMILGVDTHYIYEKDAPLRDIYLRSRDIEYPEEDGFIMDYPSVDTLIDRFSNQEVLEPKHVVQAMNSTLIVREFEHVHLDKDIKMPSLYPKLTHEEKVDKLKGIINKAWIEDRKHIPKDKWKEYIEAIQFETKIIEDTGMEDYFLLNEKVINKAVTEYGGVLTRTGRGSAPSFYVNKLLGFTEVDRLEAPVTLFATRFMSIARILQTMSLPDIDFNTADPEPFLKATKEILGEDNVYQMIAYGTMQEKDAFKTYCRGLRIPKNEYWDIADDLEKWSKTEKWGKIIEDSKVFVDVVTSMSPHPCFTKDELVTTEKGLVKISDIEVGDKVLTHKGNFKRVLNTMVNDSDDVYKFEVQGSLPTEVTGTHPFYTRDKKSKNGNMEWKSVENISKDTMIGTFVNTSSIIPRFTGLPTDDKNFWWIVGRFLGDGWLKNPRKKYAKQEYISIICCGKHEVGEIEKYADELKYSFNYYTTEERTTYRYNFMSKELYEFLSEFGSGAKNKKVPQFVLDLPEDLLKSFLDGYISADGNITDNKIRIDTVSKELAIGIQNVLHKVYKQGSTIRTSHRENNYIEGRLVNRSRQYHVGITISDSNKRSFYKDGYIWNPFKNKTILEDSYKTYNIEVEDDNSYTVNNMAVHNCAVLLLSEPISKKVGVIRGKHDVMVTLIDSGMSDKFKYLKNDYLTVTVWDIIAKVYDEIGMPIDDVRSLTSKIENDKKVWDLYSNGNVATLNQAGTPSGKPQVMQYQPQSVRELSMWVSAIRPAFSTLKSTFLNRKPFSYGIPEFDALLDTSDNFILFQESIMNVLVYCGFDESETYGLLKAIAKKEKGIIEPVHDRFIKGFVEKTGSMDDALEVWKIVENSVGYGFNSSHAYSVALDSLYGAYLKANFPLEYFSVVLNIYKDDKEKQAELIHELSSFGIKLNGLEFGKSQSEYSFDKDTNTIYKGISTVAYLNSQVADNLYNLGNTNEYDDNEFVRLAIDIIDKNLVDNRQMNILIKLGYFSRFGEDSILLEVYNTITGYQKKKANPVILNGENLPVKYSRTHTEKTKSVRIPNIHKYYELVIKNKDLLSSTTLYQRLQNEVEYMGYATTIDMNAPENHFVVMEVNTKYTPIYKLYNVFDGHEETYKIDKKKAYMKDGNSNVNTKLILNVGDVFELVRSHQRPKMQKIDDKWVQNTDVMQNYIDNIEFVEKNVDN